MPARTTLAWYEDPGHGWLRVPMDELGGYVPTEYSYKTRASDPAQYAYLEEDCDALGWANHVGRAEEARKAPVRSHTAGWIRSLPMFDGVGSDPWEGPMMSTYETPEEATA